MNIVICVTKCCVCISRVQMYIVLCFFLSGKMIIASTLLNYCRFVPCCFSCFIRWNCVFSITRTLSSFCKPFGTCVLIHSCDRCWLIRCGCGATHSIIDGGRNKFSRVFIHMVDIVIQRLRCKLRYNSLCVRVCWWSDVFVECCIDTRDTKCRITVFITFPPQYLWLALTSWWFLLVLHPAFTHKWCDMDPYWVKKRSWTEEYTITVQKSYLSTQKRRVMTTTIAVIIEKAQARPMTPQTYGEWASVSVWSVKNKSHISSS